ncbi:MAG: methylmalonyl-CoA mutase, partial [Anaerolinea sp.]|nr:methylmalonyl-CoA mutase [Anaerolinea sp.]
LAAVLGGTQSLHTNSMDEALALPTEKAVQIALRTQQVIAYESGAADTVDPLAGSWFVETLTDEIEQRAEEYIQKIDALGGARVAIEQGYMQREIQDAAYRAQMAIERKDQIVVGVNRFTTEEQSEAELLRVDASAQLEQIERLKQVKAGRDQAQVAALLARIEQAAQTADAPLMPLFVEAVEQYVTLGEICGVLRGVFGEYQPDVWV